MARVLVVADDLTGANACAAGFSRAGQRTVTVGLDRRVDAITSFAPDYDVVVATTESRHVAPLDAAVAMREAIKAGWPVEHIAARIDTTLRGNVGVAAQALIDTVAELSGRRTVALCAPAFPAANRITIGGMQLMEGRRLEDTELAHDVRSPVTTSSIEAILRLGTMLEVDRIRLSDVTGPRDVLVAKLVKMMRNPQVDVIVGDALMEGHIATLADACVEAAAAVAVELVTVDPGPATLEVARAKGLTRTSHMPLLAVSGSSTDLTISQLAHLIKERNVEVIPAILDGDVPDVEANIERLASVLSETRAPIVLWASVLDQSDIRSLDPADALALPSIIGQIIAGTLDRVSVLGLYTTGGDITAAVLDALGARGIEIADEVIPLAVTGSFVGGRWEDTPILTKGGLIGDETAAVYCIDYLASMATQRSRWVQTISTNDTNKEESCPDQS